MGETMMNQSEMECSNISLETDELTKEVERIVPIVVPTIFAFIALLGFVGNLLVIIVVLSNKQMRNTTNVLITNLAFADLFVIIICVPFTAVRYSVFVWPFGITWCKIVNFVMYCSAWGSVYTLVLMSLDRYLAVVHAIKSLRFRTTRNAILCIAVTWLVIFAVNIPSLIFYNIDSYPERNGQGECEIRRVCFLSPYPIRDRKLRTQLFYTCFLVFGYMLPLSLVCVLYGFMLRRLLFKAAPGGSQSVETLRSKKRVTRLVVIVVCIFAVCWLPIHVVLMLSSHRRVETSPAFIALMLGANVFAWLNSCVNPILYAFLSENFRRGFKKILSCGRFKPAKMDIERTYVQRNIQERDNENNENGKLVTTTLLVGNDWDNENAHVTVL